MENREADALSDGTTFGMNPELRIHVDSSRLHWDILPKRTRPQKRWKTDRKLRVAGSDGGRFTSCIVNILPSTTASSNQLRHSTPCSILNCIRRGSFRYPSDGRTQPAGGMFQGTMASLLFRSTASRSSEQVRLKQESTQGDRSFATRPLCRERYARRKAMS